MDKIDINELMKSRNSVYRKREMEHNIIIDTIIKICAILEEIERRIEKLESDNDYHHGVML